MKLHQLLLVCFVIGCTAPSQQQGGNSTATDTIQTNSGLQYFFLTKGNGRKVERGSKLDTKLSLIVDDSVVWTSYEAEDSLFSFVIGVDRVISGFEEMAYLMREGDNVVAILPDSLAYGDKGAGDVIPPNATLIYDRYEIVGVSEPKKVLSDTLFPIFESASATEMIEAYQAIVTSDLNEQYHMEATRDLFRMITQSERYEELEQIAIAFADIADDTSGKQSAWYNELMAILYQGDTSRAIVRIKEIIAIEPDEETWKSMLEDMTKKE
ncbi:MAG: FKBP-type peptidyl-prolyl cis-trans isomerase [Ekhidna sp.]|nr:FKBP-type peptidyl-prolyl cis-trans isomerase [Ekhidna sp.]